MEYNDWIIKIKIVKREAMAIDFELVSLSFS